MPPIPTRRLLLLALAAALPIGAATLVPWTLYLAGLYLAALAAAVVVDLRLGPAASELSVERRHERRLSLGEPNPVAVSVRWQGPERTRTGKRLRLWVRDLPPPEMPADRPLLEGALPPDGEWAGRYYLHPVRRGDYHFGEAYLRLEMPLGLLIRQYSFPISGPARVYPSLRAVRRYDLLARRGRLQEMGLRHARLSGAGTDFERLRDYLPDDDYRRIAWKATARRDPGGQGAAGSEAGFVAGWADPGAAPFWPFRRLPSGDADSQPAAALGRRPEPPAGVLPASPIFGGSRCVGGGLPPRRRLRPEAGLRSGGRGSGALSLPA